MSTNTATLDKFASKLGTILSRVKDTIFKDFLNGLAEEGTSWEEFSSHFGDKDFNALEQFVNNVIKKIGFDLSGESESKEVYNLFMSIIDTSVTLSQKITAIAGSFTNEESLDKIVDQCIKNFSGSGAANQLAKFENLLGSGSKGSSGDDSSGSSGGLKEIIDLIQELFDFFKKISDIEWSKIVKESGDFGNFIKDNYFTEKFAKRIVDYILITFLKNAREVFADDLEWLLEQAGDKLMTELKNKAKDFDANEFKKLWDTFKNYKEELGKINEVLKGKVGSVPQIAGSAIDGAKDVLSNLGDAVDIQGLTKKQLETYKNVLRQKIDEIIDRIVPEYNAAAKVLDKVYAVLDFLGVIGKKKIDLVSYANYISVKNKSIDDFIDLDSVEIEIPVFHWDLIQKAFTDPKSYLEAVFPLKNHDDIEKIIVKVANLVRAFNGDFPQITSIKQFIWELIVRIDKRFAEIKGDVESAVKKKFESFKAFLLDLLKVCEAIVIETRKTLKEALDDANGKFKKLGQDIQKNLGDIQKEIQSKVSKINVDETFKKIVIDTFVEAASENFKEFWDESNVETAVSAIEKSVTSSSTNLVKVTSDFVSDVNNQIKAFIDSSKWNSQYNDFLKQLSDEFKKQTKNIPDSIDKLKKFGTDALDDILSGKNLNQLSNPFSDIDPVAYYQIIVDKLTEICNLDINSFYKDFNSSKKDCKVKVRDTVKALVTDIKSQVGQVNITDKKLEVLVNNILKSWWNKIVSKFIELVIKPYVEALKKKVLDWAGDILNDVVNEVKKLIDGTSDLISQGALIDTKRYINLDQISTVVNGILELKNSDGVDSWKTWKSAIKFAINLYKVIPEDIKKYVSELINIPDFDSLSEYLPEYSFDAKNKLLAVTVIDKETEDKSGGASGKANIRIQLLLFVGEKGEGDEKTEGLYILPVASGSFNTEFNVGKKHYMSLSAKASLNTKAESKEKDNDKDKSVLKNLTEGKLGFFVKVTDKPSETSVDTLSSKDAVKAYLELLFERGQVGKKDTDAITLFDTKIASLTLEDYPQKVFVGYDNGFDAGYCGGLRNLKLALKLKDQNDFFKTILKKDIEIGLEKLDLMYSLKDGFKVDDKLHISIPINYDVDLDVVKFKNIGIDLGLEGNSLLASLKTSFTADLKGVSITFTDMGLGIDAKLPFGGHKGVDISPKFTYPNGLGISINIDGVKGGGAVQWDKDRQRFAGALELNILEKVGASALLVFTTGKGSDPFSFMGGLCVYFNPGIQLGMGFSLEGIGGSFGLNRMLSTDNLRTAVYDGTLESALFYKDIAKNVDKVLANIDKFYPIKTGQMYFGFLGKIAWGSILKADLGLFIQAPSPVTILVAGVVKVSISEKVEKLLVINAAFMGGIQFDKGIFFDASLYDSKIVGIELHGDIALRIFWGGDTKGFILSIGGFHPQYKPEAGFMLPDLKRVGLKLNYSILKFSLDAYFAITSNTVQFGTNLNLQVGWDKFGLFGYAAFNALFQFNPFKFMVDMSAGLAVKVGSKKICSIDLSFELSGPAQWHAKGKASFWVLFIKISVHFDKSWGKNQIASNRTRVDVLPLFTKEFAQNNNWKFISSDLTDNMVSLIKFDENISVLQPSDTISFNQSAIPLAQKMACYGEDDLNDIERLDILSVSIGDEKMTTSTENSSFAPSLINRLTEKQKLESESYKSLQGGFKFTSMSDVHTGFGGDVGPEYQKNVTQGYDLNQWASAYEGSIDLGSDLTNDKQVSPKNQTKLDFSDIYKLSDEDKTNKQYNKKTSGSRRRTSSGFDRFVKQWDDFMCSKTKTNLEKAFKE